MMTLLTFGIWGIVALSSAAKRILWPWACEHCGWHEPDFRSPEERQAGEIKPRARAGQSAKLRDELSNAAQESSGEPPGAV